MSALLSLELVSECRVCESTNLSLSLSLLTEPPRDAEKVIVYLQIEYPSGWNRKVNKVVDKQVDHFYYFARLVLAQDFKTGNG
jgi:hypothetical protein